MDFLQAFIKLRKKEDIVTFVTECDHRKAYDIAIGVLMTFLTKAPQNINHEVLSIIHNALGHFGCKNVENIQYHDAMVRHFVESLYIDYSEVAQYNLFKRIPYIENEVILKNVMNSIIDLRNKLKNSDQLLYAIIQKLAKSYLYEEVYKCLDAMFCKELAQLLRYTIQVPHEYMSLEDVQKEYDEFIKALEIALLPENIKQIKQFFMKTPDIMMPKLGYYMIYTGFNTLKIHILLRDLYKRIFPFLFYEGKFIKTKRSRIRLGIVTTHMNNTVFKNHSVQKVFGHIVNGLDCDKFDITICGFSTSECGVRELSNSRHKLLVFEAGKQETFQETMKRWHTKVINEDLDILLYLDIGMDPYSYLLSFARLAPIQVTTWGHPDCHGTSLDYYITSDMFNNDPSLHSEKLLYMKGQTFIFDRPSEEMLHKPALSRLAFGIPEDAKVYACVQSIFKITPIFDEVIRGILEKDPRAMIVFINTSSEKSNYLSKNIQRRLTKQLGLLATRVLIVNEKIVHENFIGFCRMADILLDSYPFSGGITSLECFMAGLPIITLSLPHIRGSQTTSYYRMMDIPDLIANTPAEYIEKAVEIANDHTKWQCISEKISKKNHIFCEKGVVIEKWNTLLEDLVQNS